jgi:hypothetical protein
VNPNLQSATFNLQSTADSYTVARAREYWAYRRHITGWPSNKTCPDYVTQFRHCPCGNATPCPTHEAGEFRPFPKYFWSLSPHSSDYARSLLDRGLPYREPTEFLA